MLAHSRRVLGSNSGLARLTAPSGTPIAAIAANPLGDPCVAPPTGAADDDEEDGCIDVAFPHGVAKDVRKIGIFVPRSCIDVADDGAESLREGLPFNPIVCLFDDFVCLFGDATALPALCCAHGLFGSSSMLTASWS